MSTQNKITSYFCKKSSSHELNVGKKYDNTKKVSYTINESEDCIVIDDDENYENISNGNSQGVNIINDADESFKKENEILNKEQEEIPNKEEIEEMFQDIFKSNYEEYGSSINNVDFKQFDDTTIFFSNLVENFSNDVSLHYLFSNEEISLLNNFSELPTIHHKKIFARMYWLKWKWHKTTSIVNKYLNIDVINDFVRSIMRELINKQFLLNGCKILLDNKTITNKQLNIVFNNCYRRKYEFRRLGHCIK